MAPDPGTISTAVGALRIRIATGQLNARKALVECFDSGLADDDALASLLLGYITNDDRVGALEALSTYGPRHGATAVENWRVHLSLPPATIGLRLQAAASPAANPKGANDADG